MDTRWFDELTRETDEAVVCCWRGRLRFIGAAGAAPFPSLVIYFGPKPDVFADVFGAVGSVWHRPPRGADDEASRV
jgi:hypothetical protein